MAPLRWGIVSCGLICHDFATAAKTCLSPDEHVIVATSARELDKAKEFAEHFKIPKAYGSYEELFADKEIDVVYIGSINPQHLPLVKQALDHGKHVLCEKPLGVNVKETKEMLDYAKAKGLFLMEAIWSRFFPSYKHMMKVIGDGGIGEPLQILATLGVSNADVDRIKRMDLGGGVMIDIGIYCIQLITFVYGGEQPEKVVAAGHLNPDGVDEAASATLTFKGGKTGTFVVHAKVTLPNEAYIVGTKGTITLKSQFNNAVEMVLPDGSVKKFPLPEGQETNFEHTLGLHYQCHEVKRCIEGGLKESSVVSHKATLQNAEIIENIRRQIGVEYPQDKK